MRNIDEIIINKAAVHGLDKEGGTVALSEKAIELTEDIYSYLEKHILKILRNEDARTACFCDGNNIVKEICSEIFTNNEQFIVNSQKIAKFLAKCNFNDETESSGDFIVVLFESQTGNYIAIMKLDFTETFFNNIRLSEGKMEVDLALVRNALPSSSQKVAKAVIIKEPDEQGNMRLLVLDKALESTFIQSFLNCEFVRDKLENTKILHTAAELFARRAFRDNAQEAERFRSKMGDFLANEDKIDINTLAHNGFDSTTINEFKAVMVSEGICENEVHIDREWAAKKLKRKRLKIDKSIELYIDSEAYKDKDKFEIKRNGDGTIDIILKNVRNYIEK